MSKEKLQVYAAGFIANKFENGEDEQVYFNDDVDKTLAEKEKQLESANKVLRKADDLAFWLNEWRDAWATQESEETKTRRNISRLKMFKALDNYLAEERIETLNKGKA